MVSARILTIVVACALVAASGASDARAETLTCQVSASGTFSPRMFPIGGNGGYELRSPNGIANSASCSYNGGPRMPSAISSAGVFWNTVCGTAGLTSPSSSTGTTTIDVAMDGTNEVTAMAYRSEMRGWQAILDVSSVNGRSERDALDGWLALRPQHSCTFQPVPSFTADGILVLEW